MLMTASKRRVAAAKKANAMAGKAVARQFEVIEFFIQQTTSVCGLLIVAKCNTKQDDGRILCDNRFSNHECF